MGTIPVRWAERAMFMSSDTAAAIDSDGRIRILDISSRSVVAEATAGARTVAIAVLDSRSLLSVAVDGEMTEWILPTRQNQSPNSSSNSSSDRTL
jgi:regulator of extracellular matrix RemA (YlzA/DUF370 family)